MRFPPYFYFRFGHRRYSRASLIAVFGRPFVKRFGLCYGTVVYPVLSVTLCKAVTESPEQGMMIDTVFTFCLLLITSGQSNLTKAAAHGSSVAFARWRQHAPATNIWFFGTASRSVQWG